MTTTTTAFEAVQRITDHMERIVNDSPHCMENMEPCDEWRQGDVRIIRLPDDFDLDANCERMEEVPVQLAPGNTLGSRHCLDSTEGVTPYRFTEDNPLDGPVLQMATPRSLVHPEHGDCVGLPVGKYTFPGQRVKAEEERRTID